MLNALPHDERQEQAREELEFEDLGIVIGEIVVAAATGCHI